jgi:cysteine desulfurase
VQSNDQKIYYFDHAATTPVDPRVLAKMEPFFSIEFANPSSLYRAARRSRAAIDHARHTVASFLGAKPTEVVFTSGGTESDNLAIQGVLSAHPGSNWVASIIEHDAVLNCISPMERLGHKHHVLPVQSTGIIDLNRLSSHIDDQTVLVSIMMANNEIGTIQPISDVAKLIADVRTDRVRRGVDLPIYLHTDAVQAALYLSLHVDRLGVDLLSLSGSKIYGPKGTGVLYIRHGTILDPILFGGGQERTRRSGTENVAGIVGFSEALTIAAEKRQFESRRLTQLRAGAITVLSSRIPGVILNGDQVRRLPNNINLTIPGANGEDLVLYLDNLGILASTGSACTTGSLDPSHVLLAIGRTAEEANCSLRLTFGRDTTKDSFSYLIESLATVVGRVRELGQA